MQLCLRNWLQESSRKIGGQQSEAVLYLVGLTFRVTKHSQVVMDANELALGIAARDLLYSLEPKILMDAETMMEESIKNAIGRQASPSKDVYLLEARRILREARTKESQQLARLSLEKALARSNTSRAVREDK